MKFRSAEIAIDGIDDSVCPLRSIGRHCRNNEDVVFSMSLSPAGLAEDAFHHLREPIELATVAQHLLPIYRYEALSQALA